MLGSQLWQEHHGSFNYYISLPDHHSTAFSHIGCCFDCIRVAMTVSMSRQTCLTCSCYSNCVAPLSVHVDLTWPLSSQTENVALLFALTEFSR